MLVERTSEKDFDYLFIGNPFRWRYELQDSKPSKKSDYGGKTNESIKGITLIRDEYRAVKQICWEA